MKKSLNLRKRAYGEQKVRKLSCLSRGHGDEFIEIASNGACDWSRGYLLLPNSLDRQV